MFKSVVSSICVGAVCAKDCMIPLSTLVPDNFESIVDSCSVPGDDPTSAAGQAYCNVQFYKHEQSLPLTYVCKYINVLVFFL